MHAPPNTPTSGTATDDLPSIEVPGGFKPTLSWRILGSAAPVFSGFEVDICDRVPDSEKQDAVWHRERARGILRDHPEVRQLFTHKPMTAFWCLSYAATHIAVGIATSFGPWWWVFAAAYLLGAYFNICLFILAHDCNHGLVFNNKRWDRWLFTATSIPSFMPAYHTWWIEHHVHHNDLGAKKDFIKRRRSLMLALKDNLFGHPIAKRWRPYLSWLTTPLFLPTAIFMLIMQIFRSFVGLGFYVFGDLCRGRLSPSDWSVTVLADEHLVSGYEKYKLRSWAVLYPSIHMTTFAIIGLVFGWKPLVYFLFSTIFMTGWLHPTMFGLILSISHFHGHRRYQPSSSYYGWLNRITFNIGLHTEHHDLQAIPWSSLPRLREIAPEYYDDLVKTPSYARLALQFAFGDGADFDNESYRNVKMLTQQTQDICAS